MDSLHGEEGVDGSSPSEGFCKSPADAGFLLSQLIALFPARSGMEQIWNNQMLKGSILSSYETTERDETAPLAPRCTVHLDLAGGWRSLTPWTATLYRQ
jgi:hypothetical protein